MSREADTIREGETRVLSLTIKYQPKKVRDFYGLSRAKAIMGNLIADPYSSAWLYVGSSGTGKSTLALAVAAEIGAQVTHVASGNCDKETVKRICDDCLYTPMFGSSPWRVLIIDEADSMTTAAQHAWLSRLDSTNPMPNCIVIFTCNSTSKLEDRFLSRVNEIEFDGKVDAKEFGEAMYDVWWAEAPEWATAPMMHRWIDECDHNVRKVLKKIETELLALPKKRPEPTRRAVAA